MVRQVCFSENGSRPLSRVSAEEGWTVCWRCASSPCDAGPVTGVEAPSPIPTASAEDVGHHQARIGTTTRTPSRSSIRSTSRSPNSGVGRPARRTRPPARRILRISRHVRRNRRKGPGRGGRRCGSLRRRRGQPDRGGPGSYSRSRNTLGREEGSGDRERVESPPKVNSRVG